MSSEFLGVGWGFPVHPDEEGRGIGLARYEQSVGQSIQVILGTARGERVMHPDFGCGIHDLVFAVNSPATSLRVAIEVKQSLLQWEPRIDVLEVQVNASGNGQVLNINISYQVRATNNVFNLVYPFYLERSAV